jgi:hypothetical protein
MSPDVIGTQQTEARAFITRSGETTLWPLAAAPARILTPTRRAGLVALLRSARQARLSALLVGAALLSSLPAAAQSNSPTSPVSWAASPDGVLEIRPFAGAFIPTGPERTFLKDAVLAGAQISARVIPQLAVTGTFGWTPNSDQLTPGAPTLDVYQYDLGVEARGAGWVGADGWDFTPFVGLGGGGRTYNYRNLSFNSTTDVDGYGSAGAELGYGRIGVRVEGRDYISQFKPLRGLGGTSTNRNDVALSAGLRIRL